MHFHLKSCTSEIPETFPTSTGTMQQMLWRWGFSGFDNPYHDVGAIIHGAIVFASLTSRSAYPFLFQTWICQESTQKENHYLDKKKKKMIETCNRFIQFHSFSIDPPFRPFFWGVAHPSDL